MRTYFSKKVYFVFLFLQILLAFYQWPRRSISEDAPLIGTITNLILNPLLYTFLYSFFLIKKTKVIGRNGFTNLMSLCIKGDFEKVKEATSAADSQINSQDDGGYSALMYACSNGNLEIVKLLLQLGANLNLETKKGNTALYFAEKGKHSDVVAMLKSN